MQLVAPADLRLLVLPGLRVAYEQLQLTTLNGRTDRAGTEEVASSNGAG